MYLDDAGPSAPAAIEAKTSAVIRRGARAWLPGQRSADERCDRGDRTDIKRIARIRLIRTDAALTEDDIEVALVP